MAGKRRAIMSDDIMDRPVLEKNSKRPIKFGLFYLGFLLIAALLILFYAGDLI